MRGVTAAPALGSVLAIGLPEPVTVGAGGVRRAQGRLEGDAGAVRARGADRGDRARLEPLAAVAGVDVDGAADVVAVRCSP